MEGMDFRKIFVDMISYCTYKTTKSYSVIVTMEIPCSVYILRAVGRTVAPSRRERSRGIRRSRTDRFDPTRVSTASSQRQSVDQRHNNTMSNNIIESLYEQ